MSKLPKPIGAPKRVLFILQYFYPDVTGFSQMLGDLTQYLAATGRYECTVLAGSTVRTTKQWNHLPDRLGQVYIRRIRTLNTGKRTLLHRLLEYSAFYLGVAFILLTRLDYDAVVCFSTPPLIGFAAAAGLALSRTPFVYYIQDLFPELLYDMGYIRSPWLIRRLSLLNQLILRRADRVVTIGRWMAKKIERNYGLQPFSIPVVENWAMNITYSPPTTNGPFVVLYTGNIGLAHDFSLMQKILERLSDLRVGSIEFRFVGAGRQYLKVEHIFSRHTQWRYSFRGYVERQELEHLLSTAHLFLVAQSEHTVGDILPSKFYGYIAAGRPLLFLGTRKSEIGETILENDIGAVVECAEDVGFAGELIARYARREESYLRTCRRAAKFYRERLGFERSAEKLDSILTEVLEA